MHELITIPERGTIIVNTAEPMDEENPQHLKVVGETDIKLVELGYLPLYNA